MTGRRRRRGRPARSPEQQRAQPRAPEARPGGPRGAKPAAEAAAGRAGTRHKRSRPQSERTPSSRAAARAADRPSAGAAHPARPPLRIIPYGGLGEIGKNSAALRLGDDVLVVDAGLAFPEEEMLGIDIVIPDYRPLAASGTVRGIVLTHGHEDHTGSLPYLLQTVQAPVYGTPLTLGLARRRVEQTNPPPKMTEVPLEPRRPVRVGPFEVEPVHVNHSIPQACAVVVRTPGGTVVWTGDFKFDQTPIDEPPTDFSRLAEIGEAGVDVLLMDSTNVERPGYAPSERVVGAALDDIFGRAAGRLLVTTFASNVHRVQQVFRTAARHGRKVALAGRSMVDTVAIASGLGALAVPSDTLIRLEEVRGLPDRQVAIVTTGSQGEPLSALTRMAMGQHRTVTIKPGDTVILSATPIPGNEGMVARTINHLYRQGAEVIYGPAVHASGHACQEELKLMLTLLRPRFFMPVHGEYRHLVLNRRLAAAVGIPEERSLLAQNGQVVEVGGGRIAVRGSVDAGSVLVDGLGGVGAVVLRDRRQLAKDGVLIALVALDRQSGELVMEPDIVSRGFVYMREAGDLIEECKKRIAGAVAKARERGTPEWGAVRAAIRETLGRYLFERTRRQPMILPMLVEV